MEPGKGAFAFCSQGLLGYITDDEKREVTYEDGIKGMAFVGVHLTGDEKTIGSPWCSRTPRVVGHVDDYTEEDVGVSDVGVIRLAEKLLRFLHRKTRKPNVASAALEAAVHALTPFTRTWEH